MIEECIGTVGEAWGSSKKAVISIVSCFPAYCAEDLDRSQLTVIVP